MTEIPEAEKLSKMYNDYLEHSRTKGSKNGERRYQYPDGSLTPEGREHYGVGPPRTKKTTSVQPNKVSERQKRAASNPNYRRSKVKVTKEKINTHASNVSNIGWTLNGLATIGKASIASQMPVVGTLTLSLAIAGGLVNAGIAGYDHFVVPLMEKNRQKRNQNGGTS